MKVALAQINTTVGDLPGNTSKILESYRQGADQGAEVVLSPELGITGYPPRDLLAKRRFVDDNLRMLQDLAGQVGSTALVVGYVDLNPERPGKEYYNAAALIRDGQVIARRFKTLLPTYDVFDEDRYFQPAESNTAVPLGDAHLGISICEDIWIAQQDGLAHLYHRDPIGEQMSGAPAVQAILNISASPFHVGKESLRFDVLVTVARKNRVPLMYCNMVGGNDELIFDGNSMVFDREGNLIAQGPAFQEALIVVDTDSAAGAPFVPPDPVATLHDALVLGLRDYTRKCGFKSVVVGLSGGIDSSVTAVLAIEALGRENVVGVSMPSAYSSHGSVTDAEQLAQNLGIRLEKIPIQSPFESLETALRDVFDGLPPDATEENIQARIRGTILMGISNKFGHMLLTTGNKSEMAVGYCTLYGDMAGGLAVIADVPKTMVYQLARFINRDRKVIPEASLTKPPSAELRPNQRDQDTLPPYEVLDEILKRYVEDSKSTAEIVAELKLEENLVRDIVRRIDLNEYKRKQAPPCLRVTTKAFGIGRRVPIAQRYVG